MRHQPTESLDDGRITFDPPASELPCFDPVCGRKVNAASMFTPKVAREGKQYAFCSAACCARFKAEPEAYDSEHHA
jgi:YHS domain-containing protein